MKIGKNLTAIVAAAVIGTFAAGCSNVYENEVVVRKKLGGEVDYFEGPQLKGPTTGTTSKEWVGRRYIRLPLAKGSEQARNYTTKNDGILMIDLITAYEIGESKEDRNKWFVEITDPETQFPTVVEGIARSVISQYTKEEVMNVERSVENGREPYFLAIEQALKNSEQIIPYGVDPESFAVWPGNNSLQQKTVQADLNRQRQNILREARAEAQIYTAKADSVRAKVDGSYAEFLNSLSPEQINYLSKLDLTSAVKQVAKEKDQDIDVHLFVQ